MTSKRELEHRLNAERERTDRAVAARDRADAAALEMRSAIVRLAKHFGFHDRYQGEKRAWVKDEVPGGYWTVEIGFIVDDLIADLDAIDQARSADEARARLGIKEEA